jgi:hypothetical protein
LNVAIPVRGGELDGVGKQIFEMLPLFRCHARRWIQREYIGAGQQ